jgi:hypothetical protein
VSGRLALFRRVPEFNFSHGMGIQTPPSLLSPLDCVSKTTCSLHPIHEKGEEVLYLCLPIQKVSDNDVECEGEGKAWSMTGIRSNLAPSTPLFRSLGGSFENTFEVFNFLDDLIMFTFISLDKGYSSRVTWR